MLQAILRLLSRGAHDADLLLSFPSVFASVDPPLLTLAAIPSVLVFSLIVIVRPPLSIDCLSSDAFAYGGSTRTAEISGIPRSRTFLSNPCSAAWFTTGPAIAKPRTGPAAGSRGTAVLTTSHLRRKARPR